MEKPISIHKIGEKVSLKKGNYRIDILGGWGVKIGEFSISIKNIISKEIIECKKAFWPVQSFKFGKRAKRILTFTIYQEGEYEILFRNPESIKVKSSNLFIASLFPEIWPNEKIEIHLY